MSDTNHRFIAAVVGIPSLALGAIVGGGLCMCIMHFHKYGMHEPDYIGWGGMFIVFGLAGLIAAVPSLLTFLVLSIVWCMSFTRQISLSIVLSVALGITAIALIGLMDPDGKDLYFDFVVTGGAMWFATVELLGLIMRKKPDLLHSSRD